MGRHADRRSEWDANLASMRRGAGNDGAHRRGDEPWASRLVALERQLPPYRPTRRQRRVARWTRPAPRRDIRWAIGRFGQILIVIGLLMFGFVGYQLWGTGIEYARAQDEATDVVEQLMAEARARAGEEPAAGTAPDTAALDDGSGLGGDGRVVELAPDVLDDPDDPASTTDPVHGSVDATPISGTPTPGAGSHGTGSTGSANPATASTPGPRSTSAPNTTAASTTVAPEPTVPPIVWNEIVWNEIVRDEQWFAYMSIPRLERTDKLIEGVHTEALKKGPGHFPTTPLPGQLGNSALAGHRTSFGGVFLEIDQLEIGDEIIIETPYGGPNNGPGYFVYVVTGSEIVGKNEVRVIETVDPDIATLTLVTCHPVRSTSKRLVVHAELDLERSDMPGPAVIPADLEPPTVLPGDDDVDPFAQSGPTDPNRPARTSSPAASGDGNPAAANPRVTNPATSAAPGTTVSPPRNAGQGTTDAADVPAITLATDIDASDADGTPASTVADPGSDLAVDGLADSGDGETDELIGGGWFDDPDAWPQIAFWGGLTTLVVLAGYLIAKVTRFGLLGLAFGIAPFVVTLYFTYQNINRLLPTAF